MQDIGLLAVPGSVSIYGDGKSQKPSQAKKEGDSNTDGERRALFCAPESLKEKRVEDRIGFFQFLGQ